MYEDGNSKDYDTISLSCSSMVDDAQSPTTDLERAESRSHLFCLFPTDLRLVLIDCSAVGISALNTPAEKPGLVGLYLL